MIGVYYFLLCKDSTYSGIILHRIASDVKKLLNTNKN